GKIDRAALPKLVSTSASTTSNYVAPSTETEQVLAELWAEILAAPRVGAHDNFFELGGDSIRSVRVMSLAHPQGLRISPGDVFDHPTVAELAALIDGTDEEVPVPPVLSGHRDRPEPPFQLPLSVPQQTLWFLHSVTPDNGFLLGTMNYVF